MIFTYRDLSADVGCLSVRFHVSLIVKFALGQELAHQESEVLDQLVGHFHIHRLTVEDAQHLVNKLQQVLFLSEDFSKDLSKAIIF